MDDFLLRDLLRSRTWRYPKAESRFWCGLKHRTHKLLTFDSNQGWISQIYGPGGMIMALYRRLFTIRRLRNHLNATSLMKLVDGLFISKSRYGLQLMGKVRTQESDPTNKDIENIQKVQNKLLRMITNTKLQDVINFLLTLNLVTCK